MNKKNTSSFSRRQFARRAAVASAAALLPAEALVPGPNKSQAPAAPSPQDAPQLSLEGQREADSRYQQILSMYGSRLDDSQKASIKKMCVDLQPALERIRKFNLENGNAPALYLKPLVEREKKPQSTAPAAKP